MTFVAVDLEHQLSAPHLFAHMPMKKMLTVTTHEALAEDDRAYWRRRTPEERLEAVEQYRQEAGKFLYEYPIRLRRVLAVTRRPQS